MIVIVIQEKTELLGSVLFGETKKNSWHHLGLFETAMSGQEISHDPGIASLL